MTRALQESPTDIRNQETSKAASPAPPPQRKSGFLIGPYFDLAFIANLYWPLLFLLAYLGGEEIHSELLFWQVYFITAPHRWITLLLVGLDRDRTTRRELKFLLFGGLIVGGCLLLRLSTGTLLCLGAIDYFWNAWHFASQHHGISRIYERRCGHTAGSSGHSVKRMAFEKICFRGFLLYVIARVAGVGWSSSPLVGEINLATGDYFVSVIPVVLLGTHLARSYREKNWEPGFIYVASVFALFLAMLAAAHCERRAIVTQLALVSAIFHSVEYLAIVTWSSTTQKHRSRKDLIGAMARKWFMFLLFFVVFLGFTNYVIAQGYQQTWILLNLIVAFLHYGYDGMIWKSPRPKLAA